MAEIIYKDPSKEVLVRIVNQLVFIRNETPFKTENGLIFETRYNFLPNTLIVCLNGLRQREGIDFDYVEEENKRFRFNYATVEDDEVVVDYIKVY